MYVLQVRKKNVLWGISQYQYQAGIAV